MSKDNSAVHLLLYDLWDELQTNWSADATGQYYKTLFLPILQSAEQVDINNKELEKYADSCVSAVRI